MREWWRDHWLDFTGGVCGVLLAGLVVLGTVTALEIRHQQLNNTQTLRDIKALAYQIDNGKTPGHGLIVNLCIALGYDRDCR
jgi:hypothetical protein